VTGGHLIKNYREPLSCTPWYKMHNWKDGTISSFNSGLLTLAILPHSACSREDETLVLLFPVLAIAIRRGLSGHKKRSFDTGYRADISFRP